MKASLKKLFVLFVLVCANVNFCGQSTTKVDDENVPTVALEEIQMGRQPRTQIKRGFTENKLDVDGYNVTKIQTIKELNEFTTNKLEEKAKIVLESQQEKKAETITSLMKQFREKSEAKYISRYTALRTDAEFSNLDDNQKRVAASLQFDVLMTQIQEALESRYLKCECVII